MHNYYYDTEPWSGQGGGPACQPASWSSGPPYEDPPPPTRAQRKTLRRQNRRTGGRKAPLIFALFLIAIGTVTAVLVVLGSNMPTLSLPDLYGDFGGLLPVLPDGGNGILPLPSASEPGTTVERAPVGTGVTLPLTAARGEALTFQELYRKCIPSIAGIRSHKTDGSASGTGVVLSADGYLITNYHVIQGASRVEVLLYDERVLPALLVGGDQTNDLAVLKVEADDLLPAEFGDSDLLEVGDVALAIGNPLGEELRGTMTDGIISAIDRDVNVDGNTMTLLQTTAALNSGNSGGALLNAYGQVVGITNMKMMSYYDTIEGLGFAIPTATAKAIVDELIDKGHIGGRPTLGITGYSLTGEAAAAQGLVPGVYVSTVERKSDAWNDGMRPGDIITECNGKTVSSVDDINAVKAARAAGDVLTLRVYRDGAYLEMEVMLMERYELDQ